MKEDWGCAQMVHPAERVGSVPYLIGVRSRLGRWRVENKQRIATKLISNPGGSDDGPYHFLRIFVMNTP